MNSDIESLSRRRFCTAVLAAGLCAGSGHAAFAQGGGGDNIRDREERAKAQPARGFTQKEFLAMPRSKFFENGNNPNARIDGFSQGMSTRLFKMGAANLPRTKSLVLRLQNTSRPAQRRAILQEELQFARSDLDGFWGLSFQRVKRANYLDHVQSWAQNPNEGQLDLTYSG